MAARATQGSLFTGAERARIKRIGEPIALVLGRLGLSPDALTVAGFGIVLVAALAALVGAWIATAAILVIGTLFDGLDGTLARVRRVIAEDGLLFIDIVDFRAAYLRNRSVEAAIKIDHPYYLTEATMECYLRRAGFAIERSDYAADHLHVSYVCAPRAAEPACLPAPTSVDGMLREIRAVQNTPR